MVQAEKYFQSVLPQSDSFFGDWQARTTSAATGSCSGITAKYIEITVRKQAHRLSGGDCADNGFYLGCPGDSGLESFFLAGREAQAVDAAAGMHQNKRFSGQLF